MAEVAGEVDEDGNPIHAINMAEQFALREPEAENWDDSSMRLAESLFELERYGEAQTRRSPPIRKMLELGIPVGLGTDGTRVSSFNPWETYYWAVSGKTVGGTVLYGDDNRLDRLTALRLFTSGSAWFSGEEDFKGSIAPGMAADFAVLNHDILSVDEEKLLQTRSVLTVVDGQVNYSSGALD